jgi:anhydro-N-acetylmuramic acid kinase
MDGLDIAHCLFQEKDEKWHFELADTFTTSYPDSWHEMIVKAPELDPKELILFDIEYGKFLGNEAKEFCRQRGLKPDFISSHGHTIFHQPEIGITFQAGSGPSLAAASGLPVVYDFRSLDVALGGQGAPLVPVGDEMLFGDYGACINLGGFSNISYSDQGKRYAHDICPCNLILNRLAQKAGSLFDLDGKLAASGKVDGDLLERLEEQDFYTLSGPRSLGREWFERHFVPVVESFDLPVIELLSTLTEHIALKVSGAIKDSIKDNTSNILITGGGAKNMFLIERIRSLSSYNIEVPCSELVEFKEALIFAFLGILRWEGRINTYRSSTGATKDSCGGVICNP